MKQLAEYIFQTVKKTLSADVEKQIVRIEGFEDIRIYCHICRQVSGYCRLNGMELVAKLAGRKFVQLRQSADHEFEAGEMLDRDWVDLDDHMTRYRNQVPRPGQKLVILMMGTDAVDDKGGLEDFFAITPQTVDRMIGKKYSRLISADLRAAIDVDRAEDLNGVVDAFFTSLFQCVPQNLSSVSAMMDRWEEEHPTLQELVRELYAELPRWGIPMVKDEVERMTLTRLKNPKSAILTQANGFIEGYAYKSPTPALKSRISTKFDLYVKEGGRYARAWPEGQSTAGLEDLRETVLRFVMGDRSDAIREKLLHTDFTILSEILRMKEGTGPRPDTTVSVRGMPLSAFLSAMRMTVEAYEDEDYDAVQFHLTKATVTGVPPKTEIKGDGMTPKAVDALRDALIAEQWRRVGYFAGGVFGFLNRYHWFSREGIPLEIRCEPENFLSPGVSDDLVASGLVEAKANARAHVVEFAVELYRGKRKVGNQKFRWTIAPQADWMMAFRDLPLMPAADRPYLPVGVLPEINVAYTLPDGDAFHAWYDTAKLSFPATFGKPEVSPVADLTAELTDLDRHFGAAGDTERSGARLLDNLVQAFRDFRTDVLENGFFTSLRDAGPDTGKSGTAASLVAAYTGFLDFCTGRNSVSEDERMDGLLPEELLFRIAGLFSIVGNEEDVWNRTKIEQAIIPPYHPAVVEKLAASMRFLCAGVEEAQEEKVVSRLGKLEDLSRFFGGIDGIVGDKEIVPCTAQYGCYSLYGTARREGKLTSSEVIAQNELVYTEDFQDSQLRKKSRESGMIQRVLEQYVDAYRNGRRSLTIAFVDPESAQIVAAALYHFAEAIRKEKEPLPEKLALRVHVIHSSMRRGLRTFLSYWGNQVLSRDDAVSIKMYQHGYEDFGEIPELIPSTADVVFCFGALRTWNGSYKFFKTGKSDSMEDCPFPAVFCPSPRTWSGDRYSTRITQVQFRAATAYTRVLAQLHMEYSRGTLEILCVTNADRRLGSTIKEIQARTVWLACIDGALDKNAVRGLYAGNTGIIGFTTGEGSEGNLNMAITCREEVVEDLDRRCQRRLRTLFPSVWEQADLERAAKHCVEAARYLDGVSLLRAMNPDDNEIHNYLAYLITRELFRPDGDGMNVLIRLDSYRHWMADEPRIPDFLLLQATPDEKGEVLCFRATVLEAKIAQSSTMASRHLQKAVEQVKGGRDALSRHFDPGSRSMERRYWFAQLYRAIVFLIGEIQGSRDTWYRIQKLLPGILEGRFRMDWRMGIVACEIDREGFLEQTVVDDGEDGIALWRIGQQAIQNILLGNALESPEVRFDCEAVIDEDRPWDAVEEEDVEAVPDDGTDNGGSSGENGGPVEPLPKPEPEPPTPPGPQPPAGETVRPAGEDAESSTEKDTPAPPKRDAGGWPPLQEVRVLIGKTSRTGAPVYWEFGHPQLAARHLLITGSSGQGKTYAIQTMLYELARQGISSVIFDYTNGFLPGKLEPEFEHALGDRLQQHYAISDRLPVNPFLQQTISLPGRSFPENPASTASRFSDILKHVYGFGDQQRGALYRACRQGIERHKEKMNFARLQEELERDGTSHAKSVLSKIQQLLDMNLFDTEHALNWPQITEREGKVTVFQLTSLDKDTQTVLTEIMLWDAWYSLEKCGKPEKPFVVVLDEAQNLSFADQSPAQKILQEGRKFGWSAWFATQFMKGALSSDEISRLQQAPVSLNFKPSAEEMLSVAQGLADPYHSAASWVSRLKTMQKGMCVVKGDRMLPGGTFGAAEPALVKVSSFAQRGIGMN